MYSIASYRTRTCRDLCFLLKNFSPIVLVSISIFEEVIGKLNFELCYFTGVQLLSTSHKMVHLKQYIYLKERSTSQLLGHHIHSPAYKVFFTNNTKSSLIFSAIQHNIKNGLLFQPYMFHHSYLPLLYFILNRSFCTDSRTDATLQLQSRLTHWT